MKAIVWTKYGKPEGLQLQEVMKPAPKEDEVLIKVHATSVTAGDCEMRRLELPLMLSLPMRLYAGFVKPKRITVLGQEVAGEVVEVGSKVTNFEVGDQVFGTTGFGFGGYAEYICLPAEPNETQGVVTQKPANLSYEEAAVVPTAGFEALHFIRKANVGPGKKVLVIGGGGSIGTFSIQLAKSYGAEVTAVDGSRKQELLRALGADHIVDYTQGDYTQSDERYDLIIDVVGQRGVNRRLKLLKPDGTYFLAFAGISNIASSIWHSLSDKKKLRIESSNQSRDDLLQIKELIEAGKMKPYIGQRFSLAEAAEAHQFCEDGKKLGNVALTVIA